MTRIITHITAALAALIAALTVSAPAEAAAMSITAGFMVESDHTYCTVSFPDPQTPHIVYTAGHCYKPGTSTAVYLGNYRIGNYIPQISNPDLDLIAIRLRDDVPSSDILLNGEPILNSWVPVVGATVCKYGATTQETCGTILSVTGSRFAVRMTADHGDSGAPIYERLGTTQESGVHLLGTVISESSTQPGVIFCTAMPAISNFLSHTWGPTWEL